MKPSFWTTILLIVFLLHFNGKTNAQSATVEGSAVVGTPGEGNQLLTFNTERPWIFRQLYTGSVTSLELYSTIGLKNFIINTTGNVGIGTLNPTSKLTIQTPNNTDGFTQISDEGIILTSRVGGVSASIGTSSNHTFRLAVNGNSIINMDPAGNVGVGLTDQLYKMDIADRIRIRSGVGSTAGLWLNNPNNSAAIAFIGIKEVDVTGFYGNNAGWGLVMNTNTGAVAVGNQNPVAGYKLSVQGNQYLNGLLLTTGDAEIGGAAQVSGNLNVSGWIGVGGTPFSPLEIYPSVEYNRLDSWTYYNNGGFSENVRCIQAHGDIQASVFVSTSDARIKDILGISNSNHDLETINALSITDYTMKDKIKYGDKLFKKVIAQEVEEIFPQVVSKNAGFIPNIYTMPLKIEQVEKGCLLKFADNHNLSKHAQKIQIMIGRETRQYQILSIPSDHEVLIDAFDLKNDKFFVYGEEVNDFLSVDYEGLTTLNISATQELSKLIDLQQTQIEAQNVIINQLREAINELKEKHGTMLTQVP